MQNKSRMSNLMNPGRVPSLSGALKGEAESCSRRTER
jgi:hypothetical protein